jgi:hypothetical protein
MKLFEHPKHVYWLMQLAQDSSQSKYLKKIEEIIPLHDRVT